MEDAKMSSSDSDNVTSTPLQVTFNGPAKYWTDAVPIGNGRLGAMVWGGVVSELIQLNEDTLWTGTPGNYKNPDAPKALSEVTSLVDSGEFSEATAASSKLFGNPTEVYQLLGDMKLEFDDYHSDYAKETYHRELDLDTATVRVRYSVGDVEFTREHFASNPDRVIVTRISASKSGTVSFMLSLDSKLDHRTRVRGNNQIIMEGGCPGKRIPPQVSTDENPKGIEFASLLHIRISDANGRIDVLDDKKLKVEGSDWAILLLVVSSSFDGPFTKPSDSKKDPTSDCRQALKSLLNISYPDLYNRHSDDYQNLFRRVSLQLLKSSSRNTGDGSIKTNDVFPANKGFIPTVERIESFKSDEDPSLVELLFQFGRYLLISCSRPGSQVANLQGMEQGS